MPHKPVAELIADNTNLLRNDAAAASIQPEEVRDLLNNMAETSDVDAKRNADAAVMAQTDATQAIGDADRARQTAVEATREADLATTAAAEAKTEAANATTAANTATTTANSARTAATTANNAATAARQIALGNRGSINNLYDKDREIEQEIVGIKNSIEEAINLDDIADWAETGNLDPIPDNKLVNAPAKPDTTARSTATNAFNIASRNNITLNRLPVFGNAQLHPGGIVGQRLPRYLALDLSNKIEGRTIAEIRVVAQGVTISVTSTSQRELLQQLNSHGAIINITMTDDNIDLIEENVTDEQQDIRFQLQYKFSGTNLGTGTPADETDEIHLGINNDSFLRMPEFVGSSNFNVTGRNLFTSGDSAVILPQIGFGLINMGRRGGTQAIDLSHHIVNFANITALTASTHGAQANNAASYGFVTANQNYRIGRTNGNRLLIASAGGSTDAIPATIYRL